MSFTTYLHPFSYQTTTDGRILSSRLFPNHTNPLQVSKETAIFWLKLAHKYQQAHAHKYDDGTMEVNFTWGNALFILTNELRELWQGREDRPAVPTVKFHKSPLYARIPLEITQFKNGIIQAHYTTEDNAYFPSQHKRISKGQANFWSYFAKQHAGTTFEQFPNDSDYDFTLSMTWGREELYQLLITDICQLWQLRHDTHHHQMEVDQAIEAQRQQSSLKTWYRNQHKIGQPADLHLLTRQGINIAHSDHERPQYTLFHFHGGNKNG